MNKYQPKSAVASIADRLLRASFACFLGIGWFVWLWGLRISALTAGFAMGGLLWLCARQYGKMKTAKKEKEMRRFLGGELALKKLLITPHVQSLLTVAEWLEHACAFQVSSSNSSYVEGYFKGRLVQLYLIAQHESQPVSIQQLIEILRTTSSQNPVLFCSTAPVPKETLQWVEACERPLQLLDRSALILLAGQHSPATDEQLAMLARKNRIRRDFSDWLQTILEPCRARRYLWYGVGLSAMAFITGQPFYPLPAAVCLTLFILCCIRQAHSGFRTGI